MNDNIRDLSDAGRARLRAAVASVAQEIERFTAGDPPLAAAANTSALLASWADLVKLLDLGVAPELRACPVCGQVGRREATLCGYCWAKLSPLPTGAEEASRPATIVPSNQRVP